MLLLNLIDKNKFTTSLSKFVINQWTRDNGKEKIIQKDENYKEYVIWFVILNWKPFIVWKVVVRWQDVYTEYHPTQRFIVICVWIHCDWVLWIPEVWVYRQSSVSYQCKSKYHYPEKTYEHQYVHMRWSHRKECLPEGWIVHQRKNFIRGIVPHRSTLKGRMGLDPNPGTMIKISRSIVISDRIMVLQSKITTSFFLPSRSKLFRYFFMTRSTQKRSRMVLYTPILVA